MIFQKFKSLSKLDQGHVWKNADKVFSSIYLNMISTQDELSIINSKPSNIKKST